MSRSEGNPALPPSGPPQGGTEDAFDVWLRQALRGSHDAVLAEPLPDTLLALLGSPSQG